MSAILSENPVMLKIADIRVALDIADMRKRAAVHERYREFIITDGVPQVTVHVEVREGAHFVPIGPGPFIIRLTEDRGRLHYGSYYEAGWMDLDGGRAGLEMAPEAEVENFLRVLYAQLCTRAGAVLLHAAGVIRNDAGFVFFGPSGSGKSTVARLSLGHTVLSDDLVIVKPVDDIARVYGVPFRGDFPEAPRVNGSADLRGLFCLVKAPEHRIEEIPAAEGIARLSSCAPFLSTNAESASRMLNLCRLLNERMPVRALHFRLDADFWRVICDD